MLDINDSLTLITSIGGNIWTLWTLSLTVNVAVLGWLIQRHGLYEIKEKIIASIGFTGFVIVIMFGMTVAYDKLDLASNDLAFTYKVKAEKNSLLISDKGLVATYISRSPDHCLELKEALNIKECSKYSNHLYENLFFVFLGWLFNIVLFWYDGFWLKGREKVNA